MFDVLLKYSSEYSISVFCPVELTQYPFLQDSHFGDISPKQSGNNSEKIISIFLFLWFYHCHGRRKNKIHSFVYRFQALNLNSTEYLSFIYCYGKENKNRISRHSEPWFDIDCLLENQQGKLFYLHAAIFEFPK